MGASLTVNCTPNATLVHRSILPSNPVGSRDRTVHSQPSSSVMLDMRSHAKRSAFGGNCASPFCTTHTNLGRYDELQISSYEAVRGPRINSHPPRYLQLDGVRRHRQRSPASPRDRASISWAVIHRLPLATARGPVTLSAAGGERMTDQLSAEAVYLRLGGLIAETPDLKADPTPEARHWVARVLALIEMGKLLIRAGSFRSKSRHKVWRACCAK